MSTMNDDQGSGPAARPTAHPMSQDDRPDDARGTSPWGGRPANGPEKDPPADEGAARPASPWTDPPQDDAPERGARQRPAMPRSLDEMLRGKGGGSGGGKGGLTLPQLPGGAKSWKLAAYAVLGLWIVLTSVHRLDPQEEGVVTRLGSYARTVGSGISFTLPLPLERLEKVPVRRINTLDIPGTEGQNLVLTGDQNVINLAYSVRWSIKEPDRYLFQLEEPEATIRDAAESAMRAAVANFTLAQALGPGRADIQAQVQRQLQAILDNYRSGVRIDDVAIRDSNAPVEVAAAFNEVNAARQQAATLVNQAEADAVRTRQRAEGEAAAFDRIYAQYRAAPEVTRRRLYYETMERVLQRADKTIVPSGVTPYLPLPELRRRAAEPPVVVEAPR